MMAIHLTVQICFVNSTQAFNNFCTLRTFFHTLPLSNASQALRNTAALRANCAR